MDSRFMASNSIWAMRKAIVLNLVFVLLILPDQTFQSNQTTQPLHLKLEQIDPNEIQFENKIKPKILVNGPKTTVDRPKQLVFDLPPIDFGDEDIGMAPMFTQYSDLETIENDKNNKKNAANLTQNYTKQELMYGNQTKIGEQRAQENKKSLQTMTEANKSKQDFHKFEDKNGGVRSLSDSKNNHHKTPLKTHINNFEKYPGNKNHRFNQRKSVYSLSEQNPENEYDVLDPEPDKNTWDGQEIKYWTKTDYRKRFRNKKFGQDDSTFDSWWQPTYDKKIEDYQEVFLKYGYKGQGFKSGSYYTKYVSNNKKFYTKDKFYGTEIYTPFWNHMRNKYQQVDCGIDCEYLGPKNYLGDMLVYVVVLVAFLLVASLIACNKQKYDEEMQIERARRQFGQNILQL